ncbi:unnamed protein product [Albugo candida]|uniref:Uncharacterized protein n=1 Tax=Albugo candida TaxID=65357 RepID=A0A024G830_9STRA|nr:unnamed protein product [Albugo candida]|eukprot:CCI42467.1 unnamed protein product [Albugo candida]
MHSLTLFLNLALARSISAQNVVKEVIDGSIFRTSSYVTVDQYKLKITEASTLVEIDLLSMETSNNRSFVDVNGDCDSAYIDSQIFLFQRTTLTNGLTSWKVIASNDDETDMAGNYGKGRKDGSISEQDSYMLRTLQPGEYMLAVGRYPLSASEALAGRCNQVNNGHTPYACQTRKAPYGNYRATIRSRSIAGNKIVVQSPCSYVGSSCSANFGIKECVFQLQTQGSYDAITTTCLYDRAI